MDEFDEVGFNDDLLPVVRGDVDHGSEKLKHKICIFSALLNHHGVVFKMLLESILAVWIELSDVPDALEKKGVSKFTSPGNEVIQLTIACEHLCVSLIRCQVDSKANQLLANYRLGAVNDKLIHERDAISESECGLCFIFLT